MNISTKTPVLRVLTLLLCLALLLSLAACNKDDDTTAPPAAENPQGTGAGDGEGEGEGGTKAPEGPLFTKDYNYHISETAETEEKELHKFNVGDTCATCGITFSEGLAIEQNADDTYSVTGRGSFTGTELAIPPTYGGIPITRIEDGAFEGDETLVSVFLGHNVKEIGKKAFANCPKLRTAAAGEPFVLTYIGISAFEGSSWDTDSRPNPVTGGAVDWYTSGFDFAIPPSVTEIDDRAFLSVKNARIILPEGSVLERIGALAFANFVSTTLTCSFFPSFEADVSTYDITFPDTLAEVGEGALRGVKYQKYSVRPNVHPTQVELSTANPKFPAHLSPDVGK